MSVTRFGVSLEEELLEALDGYVKENKYPNRSQGIRQLVSKNLVEKKWQCNHIVAGAIVLVYDHGKRDLSKNMMDIQHHYHGQILSTQHYHLGKTKCMEIIAVKGKAVDLTELSDKLIGLKGMMHGKLVMTRVD